MGINNLYRTIADSAPQSFNEKKLKDYSGRIIAVDISCCLYQYLIGYLGTENEPLSVNGESLSHLKGIFDLTIRLSEMGIKLVYVFDGEPPAMKSSELAKRDAKRNEAKKNLEKATESGNAVEIIKYRKQLVKVSKQHNDDVREMLRLLGVPFVNAPGEAEAQCAALVNASKVDVAATEDMDALAFASSVFLRHLTVSPAQKKPLQEFGYDKILKEMDFTKEQFVDLCILLGCDYCETIHGIGQKRALELVTQHKCIEEILKNIDKSKYIVPEDWNYEQARQLFMHPHITDPEKIEIKWTDPDEEGLVRFLCGDRQFDKELIRSGCKKIQKTRTTSTRGHSTPTKNKRKLSPIHDHKIQKKKGKIERVEIESLPDPATDWKDGQILQYKILVKLFKQIDHRSTSQRIEILSKFFVLMFKRCPNDVHKVVRLCLGAFSALNNNQVQILIAKTSKKRRSDINDEIKQSSCEQVAMKYNSNNRLAGRLSVNQVFQDLIDVENAGNLIDGKREVAASGVWNKLVGWETFFFVRSLTGLPVLAGIDRISIFKALAIAYKNEFAPKNTVDWIYRNICVTYRSRLGDLDHVCRVLLQDGIDEE